MTDASKEQLNSSKINEDFVLFPLSHSFLTSPEAQHNDATFNHHLDSPLDLDYSPLSSNSPLFDNESFTGADYSPLNDYLTERLYDDRPNTRTGLQLELDVDMDMALGVLDLFEPLTATSTASVEATITTTTPLEQTAGAIDDDDELPSLTPSPIVERIELPEINNKRQTRSSTRVAATASTLTSTHLSAAPDSPTLPTAPLDEPAAPAGPAKRRPLPVTTQSDKRPRTKRGRRIFNGVRATAFEVVELEAPIQPRKYTGDSLTSRKRIPRALGKILPKAKRAKFIQVVKAEDKDEDYNDGTEKDEEEYLPESDLPDQKKVGEKDVKEVLDIVAENRLKNTMHARVSRQRKAEYLAGLLKENDKLKNENKLLKAENKRLK